MLGISLEKIDEIRKEGFRPQVVGCFIYGGKILFVYKRKHNLWQLPQGGIDNQESIDQAFFREFKEELGEGFMKGCAKKLVMVGAKEVKFSYGKKNIRELNSDEGKRLDMKGKKYFFVSADVSNPDLVIDESEFDDYQWLSFVKASHLAQTINQPRKQLLTIKILNLLKKKILTD